MRTLIRSGVFFCLQSFTKAGFKIEGVVPIVLLLNVTFNPLVILGVWSPIPDIYFAPEYESMKESSTLPHPNP